MDMVQLLVTVSSRGRCDWDIRTDFWRKEEVKELGGQEVGSMYIDVEVKEVWKNW